MGIFKSQNILTFSEKGEEGRGRGDKNQESEYSDSLLCALDLFSNKKQYILEIYKLF